MEKGKGMNYIAKHSQGKDLGGPRSLSMAITQVGTETA